MSCSENRKWRREFWNKKRLNLNEKVACTKIIRRTNKILGIDVGRCLDEVKCKWYNKKNIIPVVKPTRCTNVSNLFYFWNDTLHVSDGLSFHHQEFKTVHTATDTAVCLLASRQQYLFDKCLLLYVQSLTPDDGRKDRPKHEECHSKTNKFDTLVHLVYFYYRNDITMHGPMNIKEEYS